MRSDAVRRFLDIGFIRLINGKLILCLEPIDFVTIIEPGVARRSGKKKPAQQREREIRR